MKYLKEYNDEVSKIEELSDYLQELFDKHHIVEVEEKYDGSMSPRSRYDDPYWYIHQILDGYNRVDAQIVIRNITQIPTLKEDILKIIPNIETRLGQKINLWFDPEYAVFGIKKNNYIKEWTDSFIPDDDIKPNSEDRLKWIDKEIKRLMVLANVMDESEERELLHLKVSELMDERDELRSEDGSLPPVEEEKPKKFLFVENPKTGIKEIVPNPAFSETLPPVKPNKYYHNSYYRKKTRDELASDTPIFENIYDEGSDLEKLSDCFQEIFDKFNIPQYEGTYIEWSEEEDIKKNWVIKEFGTRIALLVCCVGVDFDNNELNHLEFPENDTSITNTENIYQEMMRIKEMVERRMNKAISISRNGFYIQIQINK